MELTNQKQLKGENSMSEQATDRITDLPDSLLHHVLSLLDIKEVVRTSMLSKRWYNIWISIPTLDFRSLSDPFDHEERTSIETYQESSKFMDIVDKILRLHDTSSIQKLFLCWNYHLSASRVILWIFEVIRRNVEELHLSLVLNSTLYSPLSLCTCESLVTLELDIFPNLCLPNYVSFPKLKHFKLSRAIFSSKYNSEQFFSNCPVLENLTLEKCEWFDIRKFCLSTPSLKVLKISHLDDFGEKYGLENCAFEIHAPLVSLTYWGDVAKEFVMSNSSTLAEVDVDFGFEDYDISTNGWFDQGANISKFLRALSHVKCLTISNGILEVLSFTHDLMKLFPAFDNLVKLHMIHTASNYKALIALLQLAPNLESLSFSQIGARSYEKESDDDNPPYHYGVGWELDLISTKCLFPHLKSVSFKYFGGDLSVVRLAELVLKQATALEIMTFISPEVDAKFIMENLASLPRASASCVFNFP
ncbi:F-box/LRR-repeat protein At4g14103-like isoform X1 [Papaver somniferum]|uniref:F-box/LRR-repeat protein At4g14103-like isoform X1 n=1 Tax=Papaver somniferum TaxID=3469 RepID=UPI000E6F946B|nr:F-box/LRR-repeat protein At4g14103-like isoform X1 [Papaver somniferum]